MSSCTSEDRPLRQDLVQQLLGLLETNNCRNLEALIYLHVLKTYQQWSCCSGEGSYGRF